tara:strand:+ start:65 stop:1111 length:1047 start_codon:yes stop_codon:yes gene_type:complete
MNDDKLNLASADTLRNLVYNELIKVGVREDIVKPVAEGLIWTSLRGIDSHGIRLLPHYLEAVKGGRLNPNPKMLFKRTANATGILDADHTFGHAAGVEGMRHAIELARESGIGAVSVHNSSHCGALSFFGHAAAEADMIGMAFTHATARVKSPGASRAFFGNNPLCLVAPMLNEDPFSFDIATSAITFNAVKAAAIANKSLPVGLVADANGVETTDPKKAEQLLPIGDYKGFGLSMIVDILCAVLSGMPSGNNVSKMYGDPLNKKRELGQFYCAINIGAFRELNKFKFEIKELADRARNEPATNPEIRRVMVPGDPEKACLKKRLNNGIPIPPEINLSMIKQTNIYNK